MKKELKELIELPQANQMGRLGDEKLSVLQVSSHAMTENKNQHIKEYLDYYLALTMPPEYAILLRGKWGCGKSWFIKKYKESNKSREYLYVSLNGVTIYSEIEDDFFQQLHPKLASKGMKLVGKVLKGVLKTTIKVDLDNDGKEEGNISSGIPDINLPDYLKNLQDRVLIFDDLERCSISIPNILGYINQFVEQNGLKVIIIANEEEIIKLDNPEKNKDNTKAYLSIKEKLIGKSFDIQFDFASSLNEFIGQLSHKTIPSLLKSKATELEQLFNVAGYNNLRHLRIALLDFERFYDFLPDVAKTKQDLADHIFELFFSISFELKKGALIEDEIKLLFTADITRKEGEKAKTTFDLIKEKYSVFGRYYHPISPQLLSQFFKNGTVDKTLLKECIENSNYFQKENTANWMRLWHYYDLNDDEYTIVLGNVYKEFESFSTTNKYELLHITGTLLRLSHIKLVSKSKTEILALAKKNVDSMKSKGHLVLSKHEEFPPYSYLGLGFNGSDLKEYKAFIKYMTGKIAAFETENYPKLASELLQKLDTAIDEFTASIGWAGSGKNIYYDIPILSFIDIKDFVTKFIALPNRSKKYLGWAFEKRYKYPEFNKSLQPEIAWLKTLRKELMKVKNKLKGKPSGHIIEFAFVESLNKSIIMLEEKHEG